MTIFDSSSLFLLLLVDAQARMLLTSQVHHHTEKSSLRTSLYCSYGIELAKSTTKAFI